MLKNKKLLYIYLFSSTAASAILLRSNHSLSKQLTPVLLYTCKNLSVSYNFYSGEPKGKHCIYKDYGLAASCAIEALSIEGYS